MCSTLRSFCSSLDCWARWTLSYRGLRSGSSSCLSACLTLFWSRTQYWQLGWSWKGCNESPTNNTGTKSAQVSLATPHCVLLTLEQYSCSKAHSCTTLYYALCTMHYAHSSCLKAPSCHPLTCQLYASTTASPPRLPCTLPSSSAFLGLPRPRRCEWPRLWFWSATSR